MEKDCSFRSPSMNAYSAKNIELFFQLKCPWVLICHMICIILALYTIISQRVQDAVYYVNELKELYAGSFSSINLSGAYVLRMSPLPSIRTLYHRLFEANAVAVQQLCGSGKISTSKGPHFLYTNLVTRHGGCRTERNNTRRAEWI